MIRFRAMRGFALLTPLLLGACGFCSGSQTACAVTDLQSRLQAQLSSEIATGKAVVTPLPDGARVSISDSLLFAGSGTDLVDNGALVIARVIEGMLDPALMSFQIADSASMSDIVPIARTQAVLAYFNQPWIGPATASLAPPQPVTSGTPLPELTVTAHVAPR